MTRNWTEDEFAAIQARRGAKPFQPPDVSATPFKMPGNEAGHFALGRLPDGQMNRTEAAYAAYLDTLKHAGEVLWWMFEGVKLKLAAKTFFTVDFFVLMADRSLEAHEVKGGFWQDDARVKIKVAASIFPFKFIAIKRAKGGGWEREEFA